MRDGDERVSVENTREAEIGVARRFYIPFFPTLLGALAVLNVASVVLALVE